MAALASNRGRVEEVEFEEIRFNGKTFWRAQVEIDHINHGLNEDSTGLNEKARSTFTVSDVIKFIKLLDGEYIKEFWKNRPNTIHRYVHEVDSPIKGPSFKKKHRMVFETRKNPSGSFLIVTLYKA